VLLTFEFKQSEPGLMLKRFGVQNARGVLCSRLAGWPEQPRDSSSRRRHEMQEELFLLNFGMK
jgi:hypothetical protein